MPLPGSNIHAGKFSSLPMELQGWVQTQRKHPLTLKYV